CAGIIAPRAVFLAVVRCYNTARAIPYWKRDVTFVQSNKAGMFQPRAKLARVTTPFGEPLKVPVGQRGDARFPVKRAVAALSLRRGLFNEQVRYLDAKRGDYIIDAATSVTFKQSATVWAFIDAKAWHRSSCAGHFAS